MPLSIRDRNQLTNWVRSRATLAEVEEVARFGLVGNERFTEAARDAFRFLWSWSSIRFAGEAGRMQDAYFKRHGLKALSRRIDRVNRLAKTYCR